jgi:sugar-specific transcriptional regulator TrmB
MGKYTEILREYGLTKNEGNIYITLLKLKQSSVQQIAKNASLPRTTTYHLLESLSQKGLVSFIIKEKIKFYQSANPRVLVETLNEKKKKIKEIIPELTALGGSITDRPKTQVYEGIKGIRTILEDILETKDTILHYGDIISLENSLKYIFPQFIIKRIKKRIPIKIICRKEDQHSNLIKSSKKEFRKFRFVPKSFTFKSSVFLYGNKVAILSLTKEPFYGILIENKDFFQSQRNLFELIWKILQP